MGAGGRQGEPDLFLGWRAGGHKCKPRPSPFTSHRLPSPGSLLLALGVLPIRWTKEVPPRPRATKLGQGGAGRGGVKGVVTRPPILGTDALSPWSHRNFPILGWVNIRLGFVGSQRKEVPRSCVTNLVTGVGAGRLGGPRTPN